MLLKKQVLMEFQGSDVLGQMVQECTQPSELQNSKIIGEMLTRHDKGRANPVAWKQDKLRFGIGVGFYCFWSWNIKLSFSEVLFYLFMSLFTESYLQFTFDVTGSRVKPILQVSDLLVTSNSHCHGEDLAWGKFFPSRMIEQSPEEQISLFSSHLLFLFFLWF